ncbi:hypothetical protein ACU8KO_002647 [Vibrio alginolyticus]
MLVTITEKFTNGVYLKAATTVVDGRERLLCAAMCFGARFAEKLSKFEDGMHNVTTVELSSKTFKMKGVLVLDTPVVAPSNQVEAEVVA